MRQVSSITTNNPCYGIIGQGRLARHLIHYFSLVDIPFISTSSRDDKGIKTVATKCDIILLAIADKALLDLYHTHSILQIKPCVHFSGALYLENIIGCHPLMTFSYELYPLQTYQSILFTLDSDSHFSTLFPKLNNPHILINAKDKPYYHALCVMANNFTTLLWQHFFDQMQSKFGAAQKALSPFLMQTLQNINQDYKHALTGPLARGDQDTIEKNLSALNNDAFKPVYESFINAYTQQQASDKLQHTHRRDHITEKEVIL
ncbi:Rossmann-like and DUF2520 domain-containing protein [Fangia hongkongensis]|uniref:Rossmann-like and DUF2520 domain-containing protein n=1 Tax=Fangia hongkongensis TaxID=270495 RepID=UPI00036CC650|nr:Rossmann-like and DUF2520 domain-containing protein [Fangia hongkongensis]MBK2125016.1 DUF2520 domain-containing protein [Fangia hongkongensis]